MATPHRCPVCNGTGSVLKGFYEGSNNATGIEECRACTKGIIWDYTNIEYYSYPTSKVEIESNNPCDNCSNKNSNIGCLCTLRSKTTYGI